MKLLQHCILYFQFPASLTFSTKQGISLVLVPTKIGHLAFLSSLSIIIVSCCPSFLLKTASCSFLSNLYFSICTSSPVLTNSHYSEPSLISRLWFSANCLITCICIPLLSQPAKWLYMH